MGISVKAGISLHGGRQQCVTFPPLPPPRILAAAIISSRKTAQIGDAATTKAYAVSWSRWPPAF